MDKILNLFEKYGFLFVLLNCFSLLQPDIASKTAMMDLNLESFNRGQSGGSVRKQVSWLLPMMLYIACILRVYDWFSVSQKYFHLGLLFSALLGICMLSVIWSVAPAFTVKRTIFQTILIFVLMSGVFFTVKHRTFSVCVNALVIVALVVGLITVLLGTGFVGGGFVGWAKTKNSLGAYVLGLIALLYLSNKYCGIKIKFYNIKLALLFVFVLISASKTAVALSFLFLLFGYCKSKIMRDICWLLLVVLVSVFVVAPGLSLFFSNPWNIALHMEPDAITGRGLIWDTLYYDLLFFNEFSLGYGYAAYFATGVIPYFLDDHKSFLQFLNSAHNGYIELLLQFGFIFSSVILCVLYRMVKLTNNSDIYLLSVVVFIHNITESSFLRDQHVIWVLFVIVLSFGVIINSLSESKMKRTEV